MAKAIEFGLGETTRKEHIVNPRHMVLRVREPVHELTVVRKQKQTFRAKVQAPHRNQASFGALYRRDIKHGGAAFGVGAGRDGGIRLVQHPVIELGRFSS